MFQISVLDENVQVIIPGQDVMAHEGAHQSATIHDPSELELCEGSLDCRHQCHQLVVFLFGHDPWDNLAALSWHGLVVFSKVIAQHCSDNLPLAFGSAVTCNRFIKDRGMLGCSDPN